MPGQIAAMKTKRKVPMYKFVVYDNSFICEQGLPFTFPHAPAIEISGVVFQTKGTKIQLDT